jgi:hypothetical protein
MEVSEIKVGLRDPLYLDYFVHPLPLMAVGMMAVNDHILKSAYPSLLTGKLSDFLGLFFFPLLLCSLICLMRNFVLPPRPLTPWFINSRLLLICISISSLIFIGLKTSSWIREDLTQIFWRLGMPIQISDDKTDLWALSSNFLCYFFGSRFFGLKANQRFFR